MLGQVPGDASERAVQAALHEAGGSAADQAAQASLAAEVRERAAEHAAEAALAAEVAELAEDAAEAPAPMAAAAVGLVVAAVARARVPAVVRGVRVRVRVAPVHQLLLDVLHLLLAVLLVLLDPLRRLLFVVPLGEVEGLLEHAAAFVQHRLALVRQVEGAVELVVARVGRVAGLVREVAERRVVAEEVAELIRQPRRLHQAAVDLLADLDALLEQPLGLDQALVDLAAELDRPLAIRVDHLQAVLDLAADRAVVLAVALLPVTVLLAGRVLARVAVFLVILVSLLAGQRLVGGRDGGLVLLLLALLVLVDLLDLLVDLVRGLLFLDLLLRFLVQVGDVRGDRLDLLAELGGAAERVARDLEVDAAADVIAHGGRL